jgi:hypothetical protein
MRLFWEAESDQLVSFLRKLVIIAQINKTTDFPVISSLLFKLALRELDSSNSVPPLQNSIFCSRISTTYPSGYTPFFEVHP